MRGTITCVFSAHRKLTPRLKEKVDPDMVQADAVALLGLPFDDPQAPCLLTHRRSEGYIRQTRFLGAIKRLPQKNLCFGSGRSSRLYLHSLGKKLFGSTKDVRQSPSLVPSVSWKNIFPTRSFGKRAYQDVCFLFFPLNDPQNSTLPVFHCSRIVRESFDSPALAPLALLPVLRSPLNP